MMLTGFPPIVDDRARVLVLGSMPSAASLQQGQYYAHPRNLFWRITGEVLGFDAEDPYPVRTAALRDAGIALWDVLHSCERVGSLDASIARDSMTPNDFRGMLRSYPGIRRLFFNGAKAEQLFHRLLHLDADGIVFRRLPSTSPANAAIGYEAKLRAWRAIDGPVAVKYKLG
jgi:hypoxanthine-DNA glycosylase